MSECRDCRQPMPDVLGQLCDDCLRTADMLGFTEAQRIDLLDHPKESPGV